MHIVYGLLEKAMFYFLSRYKM